ncbi:hypothetical protein [Marininema halotolerans]|uniref:Uncharacterized protein n=1 Tax=Marininema halotolerans TaxID=1155944 RepID=A0A1I6U013_9BACL|nr:hypothetical protein [Marininema halotolerans]SFS94688.1 hypothetical protein SAMN05444972_11257 [Marininema halotolerans]
MTGIETVGYHGYVLALHTDSGPVKGNRIEGGRTSLERAQTDEVGDVAP